MTTLATSEARRAPAPASPFLEAPSEPIETKSEVARRLLAHVTSGHVAVGERLPSERQLAETLGVSRAAIRQALSALDLIGIISIRHGSGTYLTGTVSDLLPKAIDWSLVAGRRRLMDLVDARQYLEVITAGRAAERTSPQAVARLEASLAEMEAAADDPNQFVEADIGFHLLVAELSDNSVIADSLANIGSLLRVWILRAVGEEHGRPLHALKEHQAVLAAIATGDRVAAETAMRIHMTSAADRLRASLLSAVETS